tara:strand:- start:934 stop:2292 length:1359 start_codon:yes stop_codon:yes gene_type:complete
MLKKIFSYGFFEAISKGLNRSLIFCLPLFLSTTDYGKVGILISVELLLPAFTVFGLDRALLRFFHEKKNYPSFTGTIFRGIFLTHSVLILITFFISLFVNPNLFGLSLFPDIFLLLILVFLQSLNLIFINLYRAEENHGKYFKLKLLTSIIKVFVVILFLFEFSDYKSYLYGSIISLIIVLAWNLYHKNNELKYFDFNTKTLRNITAFGWPFVMHGLSLNLLGHADKFVIERMIGIEQVGIYTLAYSVGASITFAFQGISTFMEPLIYKEKDNKLRNLLLSKYFLFCFVSSIIFGVLLVFLSESLLTNFYKNEFNESLELIPFIMMCFLLTPYYLKANYELIYKKKTIYIALCSIFCAIMNIIINIILIPDFGLKGAIIATYIAYFAQNFLFTYYLNKQLFQREILEIVVLGAILLFVIIFCISYYYTLGLLVVFALYKLLIFKNKANLTHV